MYVFSSLIDSGTRQALIQLLGDLTKTQRKKRRGQMSLRCDVITLQTMKRFKSKDCKHSCSNVNMPNFREARETLLHAIKYC